MSRESPSMTALLDLLVVASYQHRDKITEMLGGTGKPPTTDAESGVGSSLGQIKSNLGGASAGGLPSGRLSELVDRFEQNGHAETVDSWIGMGTNRPIPLLDVEKAIGPDVLETFSRQIGVPREEVLARLSRELPNAIDRYTPQGRLPTEADLARS